jgi:C4-dicarboxylate transporter DctQ subunit
MLRKLDKKFEDILCVVFLSLVVGSVSVQVILRYFFEAAAAWAEETAVYGMIFAVYIGAALATRERAHIRITMLVYALPRSLQVACVVVSDFLWVCFVLFMIVQTTTYTNLLFNVTYQTAGLGIEQRWVQMFVPVFFVLMLFRIIQVYWYWRQDNFKGLPL